MKQHGTYKLAYRRRSAAVSEPTAEPSAGFNEVLERFANDELRIQRLLESLRDEIVAAGDLRIRKIFGAPREIYRLELELPQLGYQRTTLLDRDALEELLAADGVREVVETCSLGG